MGGQIETTTLGWNAISVQTPANWTLAAIGGDKKSGFLRVDEEQMPRLQVKWSQTHINLERKRDEYARRLVFGKRKRPTGLEVDTDARIISQRSKPGKDLVSFAWRGRHCGMGVLWNCEVCKRSLIAQVTWQSQERYHDIAREILASLEDHGINGWQVWGMDGLSFWAPESYQLTGWKRMTRYLEFRLVERRKTLKVARWGMVPLVLGELTLMQWYHAVNRRRRDVLWQAKETNIKDHGAIAIWGERRKFALRLRKWAGKILRRPPVPIYLGCSWHCPEANRLYLVESIESAEGVIFKGVVDSIRCHGS